MTGAAPAAPAPRGSVGRVLVGGIGGYQRWVSPFLGSRCRFYPSCSAYAAAAIATHGALRGSWLAMIRLLKCGPWHPGGVDRVPARRDRSGIAPGGPHASGAPPRAADGLVERGSC